MKPPARSWLYVPAHNDSRILRALTTDADAVILDLEDAVPAEQKELARANACKTLADRTDSDKQIWVRVNDATSPWFAADVAALAGSRADGLRIPKVESADSVRRIADETGFPLQLLVETARGLLAVPELASAHSAVAGISLGEADLAADLRVSSPGLDWARGWLVAAARAAGLPSPIQSVWTHVSDLDGLRGSSETGREQGFHGRTVIHPKQIPVVNDVFTPSDEQVRAARAVLDAADHAARNGSAALLDADGRFIDPAVVEQARVVLALVRTTP